MTSLTIEQIAELAQISRSTVSRVLNNHPNVRPAVRERVLRVIDEQGYAPHAAARSLARRRTNVIGLILPKRPAVQLSDPFFGLATQGIIEGSARLGYVVMLSKVTADTEHEFLGSVLRGHQFAGVITFSIDVDDPLLPLLKHSNTPLVVCGSRPHLADVTWIDAQQREGGHRAALHLLQLQHRCIATITGPLHDAAARERRDGYIQALCEWGLSVAPELIVEGDWTHGCGYAAMQQLLGLPQRPTAVFVANDTMALGAIRAINEAGLTVPHDVALVSFDDLPLAAYATPPLTTIRAPIAEGGAAAVKLLVDQLEQGDTSVTHVRLPTELIIRSSCGASVLSCS